MKVVLAVILAVAFSAAGVRSNQHVHQPAASQTAAATSALSAEAVQQLLNGEGMGLAKPAEMNGYAGPKHVQELKTELALSPEQERQVEAIRQRMLERATALGRQIVEAERALDAAFKEGRLTPPELSTRVAAIARLQGDLRLVHLQAHLETKPVLTDAQTRKYYELRSKHH
jgi:Spy/CpxP family protein refolding chaperone